MAGQRCNQISSGGQTEKPGQLQQYPPVYLVLVQGAFEQRVTGPRYHTDMRFGLVCGQAESLLDPVMPRIRDTNPVLGIQGLLKEPGLQRWDQTEREIGFSRLQ
jgi:hypothetical protein